jgi:hypothetical protein
LLPESPSELGIASKPTPKRSAIRKRNKRLVALEGMALTLDADLGFRVHKF